MPRQKVQDPDAYDWVPLLVGGVVMLHIVGLVSWYLLHRGSSVCLDMRSAYVSLSILLVSWLKKKWCSDLLVSPTELFHLCLRDVKFCPEASPNDEELLGFCLDV